jgi:hypothetical protein
MAIKAATSINVEITLVTEEGSNLIEVRTGNIGRLLGKIKVEDDGRVGDGEFFRSTPVRSESSMAYRTCTEAAEDIVLRSLIIAGLDPHEEAEYHRFH